MIGGFGAHSLPEDTGWRVMMGVAVPPALLCLVGMFWMPESPRWLYAAGQPREAEAVLNRCETPLRSLRATTHPRKDAAN